MEVLGDFFARTPRLSFLSGSCSLYCVARKCLYGCLACRGKKRERKVRAVNAHQPLTFSFIQTFLPYFSYILAFHVRIIMANRWHLSFEISSMTCLFNPFYSLFSNFDSIWMCFDRATRSFSNLT